MDTSLLLFFIGALIFIAHFFGWLFSFTKVPDVLLLLLLGFLLGPILGLITPAFFGEAGLVFAIIVLTIMLFESGTELRIDVLKQAWKGTLALSIMSFVITVLAVGGFIWGITDLPPLLSFMVAAMIGGTSSAVVIPMIEGLQIDQRANTILLLESAVSDVMAIVLTIALLTAHQLGEFNIAGIIFGISWSFAGAIMIGIMAGIGWSVLLGYVRQMQNSIFSTPAFVFILFGIAETIGLSGAIVALAFGITLGNVRWLSVYLQQKMPRINNILRPTSLNSRERLFFSEVVFILQTFFFVFVGLSIPLNLGALIFAIVITILLFIIRIPVVRFTISNTIPATSRGIMAIMVPKGLAAAVLATLAVEGGIMNGEEIQSIVYLVILVSVIGVSLLVVLQSKTPLKNTYSRLVGIAPNALPQSEEDARIT